MTIWILHLQGVAWRKHDETAAIFQKLHERETVTGVERERIVRLADSVKEIGGRLYPKMPSIWC